MTENPDDTPNQRIVIDFTDTSELSIETLDIGVADDTIAFDITGTIEDIPEDTLSELGGAQLEPEQISFTVADAA